MKERGIEISDVLLLSPKEEMEITLDYLDSTWGNAEMYLKECGVNAEVFSEVEKNFGGIKKKASGYDDILDHIPMLLLII